MFWIVGGWIIITIEKHSSLEYVSPAAFAASYLGSDSATIRQSQDRDKECHTLVETGT